MLYRVLHTFTDDRKFVEIKKKKITNFTEIYQFTNGSKDKEALHKALIQLASLKLKRKITNFTEMYQLTNGSKDKEALHKALILIDLIQLASHIPL